ncbi:MAG: exosortase U [Planctomycetes bacterium]|nr:exosortase U [Planctomycetota bacterium]
MSVLLIATGYVPLLWWHLSSLLARPHYQFVLILPVLLALLIRSRDGEGNETGDFRWRYLVGLMYVGSLGLLIVATWAWSPWLAMLSVLIGSFCIAWSSTGWKGAMRWLPAWVMCWVLLPPPFGSDERLTLNLRHFTTHATSQVLDLFGVLHASYVNVIEVPQKKLFVADACSGVHSLFVLLAASLFWGLFWRRSVLHVGLSMISAFGIVLVENITRLVLIVLGLSWNMDLSSGPDHTALGLILFAASVGLIISTDQLFLFLLPQRTSRTIVARTPSAAIAVEGVDSPKRRMTITLLSPLFATAGLAQWATMPEQLPDLTASFWTMPDLKEFGEGGMPPVLQGFSRIDYSRIQRVVGDPFGQQSEQWVYGKDSIVAQLSIDYPYDSFHDATICYSQIGWKIDNVAVESIEVPANDSMDRNSGETRESIAVVRMSRGLEGDAILMFSQLDQDGRIHSRFSEQTTGSNLRDATRRLQSFLSRPPTPTRHEARPPLTQIQMIARSAEPLTNKETQELLLLYINFRGRAKQQLLTNPQPPAASNNLESQPKR